MFIPLFIILTTAIFAQNRVPNPYYTAPEGKPLEGIRICVDPGHGGQIWGNTRGYTGGTRSCVSNQSESDANLRVGLFLWDLLTQAGAEVVMTRTFETRLSEDCLVDPETEEWKANRREELNIRCRVAEANDSDFLISIHHNAFNQDVNFISAFYFESGGEGNTDVRHSPESAAMAKKLAQSIIDNLDKQLKIGARPAKHGNYHVLRETSLPAVIVECGFMTSPEQAEWMEDMAYSRLAAIGIFEGILEACKDFKPLPKTGNKEVL